MSAVTGPSAPPLARRAPAAVAAVQALRIHQWAKNLLVGVAALGAHRLREPAVLADVGLAFAAFSLAASSVYVTNDLLDVAADRRHPTKRHRPFASGALPAWVGVALAPALLACGGAIALLLPLGFRLLLAAYVAATLAYSLGLKRRVILDVLVLAGLYTARIFAGAFSTGIPVTEWLATFSMFLFLSLALAKRAAELVHAEAELPGRGYLPVDREPVFALGAASGYLSVLVLAFYISGEHVRSLYARPDLLWALCPLVLYFVSRLWVQVRRGAITGDPIVFALRDGTTYVVGALSAVLIWLAS